MVAPWRFGSTRPRRCRTRRSPRSEPPPRAEHGPEQEDHEDEDAEQHRADGDGKEATRDRRQTLTLGGSVDRSVGQRAGSRLVDDRCARRDVHSLHRREVLAIRRAIKGDVIHPRQSGRNRDVKSHLGLEGLGRAVEGGLHGAAIRRVDHAATTDLGKTVEHCSAGLVLERNDLGTHLAQLQGAGRRGLLRLLVASATLVLGDGVLAVTEEHDAPLTLGTECSHGLLNRRVERRLTAGTQAVHRALDLLPVGGRFDVHTRGGREADDSDLHVGRDRCEEVPDGRSYRRHACRTHRPAGVDDQHRRARGRRRWCEFGHCRLAIDPGNHSRGVDLRGVDAANDQGTGDVSVGAPYVAHSTTRVGRCRRCCHGHHGDRGRHQTRNPSPA